MAIPKLKQLIFESGKMQKDIAQELGVSPQVFSKWVRGESFPNPDYMYKLAKYFNVSMEELYKWDK